MSALICSECGGITNSAVCNYRIIDNHVFKCYAQVVNGKWVKGCGYDDPDCDQWIKPSIDSLLGLKVGSRDFDEFEKFDEGD
jgi:hypothetical protein